jgi:hypothetical protein
MAFDFTSRPLRPRKSDRLFQLGLPNEPGNAYLRSGPDAYTLSYRRAAQHLAEYAIAHQHECATLALPIVFLYRHHVELALKRIIYCAPGILRRDLTDLEKKHLGEHRLDLLWEDLEPIFASICDAVNFGKPLPDDLYGVHEYIRQLSEVDPNSMNFRYWKSKKGQPALPTSFASFNIGHFSEMMGRLADFLDSLDTATTAASEMLDDLDNAY